MDFGKGECILHVGRMQIICGQRMDYGVFKCVHKFFAIVPLERQSPILGSVVGLTDSFLMTRIK